MARRLGIDEVHAGVSPDDKHEVVKVKNGYGRNYLIPKGLAIVANKSNMARLDGLKKQFAKKWKIGFFLGVS